MRYFAESLKCFVPIAQEQLVEVSLKARHHEQRLWQFGLSFQGVEEVLAIVVALIPVYLVDELFTDVVDGRLTKSNPSVSLDWH